MRVLFVSQGGPIWGVEQSMLRLAPLLADRGVEPRLASPPRTDLQERWRQLGFAHIPLSVPRHDGLRSRRDSRRRAGVTQIAEEGVTSARWMRAVASAARDVHVVHSHSLWCHLDVALAGRAVRRPVVLHVHDLVVPGIGRRLLELATRIAPATVAISQATAQAAGAGPRVTVLSQGIDLDRFAAGPADASIRCELGATDERPLVGIIGRVDPEKGIDTVIRAVGLTSTRPRLAVIGSPLMAPPGYLDQLEVEARISGADVRFVPPRTDIPAVLRSLDVLVSGSRAEPFGLTILEAQGSGTPVVAGAAGGALELVDDGRTGLLVPPGDAHALAGALDRLLSDGELTAAVGRAGRLQAEQQHDQERYADEVVRLYHRLSHHRVNR